MNTPYQAYPARTDPDYWRKALARGPALDLRGVKYAPQTPEGEADLAAWYSEKDKRSQPTGD